MVFPKQISFRKLAQAIFFLKISPRSYARHDNQHKFLGNANEILGWNPNDQFKRPKRNLKPSVLVVIRTVLIYSMIYLFFYCILLFSLLSGQQFDHQQFWAMPKIFETLWLLKNVLSDIVTDISYITHKCTTVYVYWRVITKKSTKNKQKSVKNK